METDRNRWQLSLGNLKDEALVNYIKNLEEDLQRTETFLEIAWEEVHRRW